MYKVKITFFTNEGQTSKYSEENFLTKGKARKYIETFLINNRKIIARCEIVKAKEAKN